MLDTIIGLLAVFLVVALVASSLVECWVRLWGLRLRHLRAALIDLLDCQPQSIQACPERQAAQRLVDALLAAYRRERALDTLPGHIPPAVFARLLLRLQEMHPPALRRHLADITHGCDDPQAALGQWFATAMQEVSDRWRWHTRLRLAMAGTALAIVANIDAIFLLRFMLDDPASAIALAERVHAAFPDVGDLGDLSQAAQLWSFLWRLPLGWPLAAWHWAVPLGWLLTGAAAAAGAPFWWDLLRSLLRLRGHSEQEAAAKASPTAAAAVAEAAPPAPVLPDARRIGRALQQWQDPAAQAVVMAACSALVYESPWKAEEWWQQAGIRALPFADAGVGTQGVVLDLGPSLAVVFRGTEMRAEDWATDARFVLCTPPWLSAARLGQRKSRRWSCRLRSWWRRVRGEQPLLDTDSDEPAVHSGFDEALSPTLWRHIGQLQQELRRPEHGPGCIYAGHSLGAALATLAAARAALKASATSASAVYTFGQPRVGNTAFAAWYNQRIDCHYAYASLYDPVSILPPRALGYAPVGQLRLVHACGRIEHQAPLWYQHLAQGAAFWQDGSSALFQGIHAHSIHSMLAQLLQAWKSPAGKRQDQRDPYN